MEEDFKGCMVVQTRQRIVQRFIGELIPRHGSVFLSGRLTEFPLFSRKVLKFIGGQRPGEIIPLHHIAPHALKRQQLLGSLHAFGDGRDLQRLRQLNHCLQQPGVLAVPERVPDKLHVQLQGVHRQRRDHIERGIAGAEIIHLDLAGLQDRNHPSRS